FGARPDASDDVGQALRQAAVFAHSTPGTTLFFPPGIYRLRDDDAVTLESSVMQGNMGSDPEKKIFRPYYPHVRGLDFSGAEDLTISAEGATLLCEGWMEPLSLIGVRRALLQGLTIDYATPPFTQGCVTDADDTEFLFEHAAVRRLYSGTPSRAWLSDQNA
ncbi:MAG: hypothetical protein OSB41_15945, partial [Kiritimatiellae bacterium]|nr:hypothetical protein [Kiritimatiellia bacterium]